MEGRKLLQPTMHLEPAQKVQARNFPRSAYPWPCQALPKPLSGAGYSWQQARAPSTSRWQLPPSRGAPLTPPVPAATSAVLALRGSWELCDCRGIWEVTVGEGAGLRSGQRQ